MLSVAQQFNASLSMSNPHKKSRSNGQKVPRRRVPKKKLEVVEGRVKWFDPDKGYGFITRINNGIDIFMNHRDVWAHDFLLKDQLVLFSVSVDQSNRPKAINVRLESTRRTPLQFEGQCSFFHSELHYGFISVFGTPHEIFFHQQDLADEHLRHAHTPIVVATPVSFEVDFSDRDRPRAAKVTILSRNSSDDYMVNDYERTPYGNSTSELSSNSNSRRSSVSSTSNHSTTPPSSLNASKQSLSDSSNDTSAFDSSFTESSSPEDISPIKSLPADSKPPLPPPPQPPSGSNPTPNPTTPLHESPPSDADQAGTSSTNPTTPTNSSDSSPGEESVTLPPALNGGSSFTSGLFSPPKSPQPLTQSATSPAANIANFPPFQFFRGDDNQTKEYQALQKTENDIQEKRFWVQRDIRKYERRLATSPGMMEQEKEDLLAQIQELQVQEKQYPADLDRTTQQLKALVWASGQEFQPS